MANASVSVTYDTGRLFNNTLQDKFDSVLSGTSKNLYLIFRKT